MKQNCLMIGLVSVVQNQFSFFFLSLCTHRTTQNACILHTHMLYTHMRMHVHTHIHKHTHMHTHTEPKSKAFSCHYAVTLPSGQRWGTCALLRCYESAQACPPGAGLVTCRRLYQVSQVKAWAPEVPSTAI